MRVVVCGSRSFGRAVLQLALDRGYDVPLVVAPPWRDTDLPGWADGGERDRLWSLAESQGLRVIDPQQFCAAAMPADEADLIVLGHAHNFVSRASLDRARLGGIGYHPSLLPRHRGRDAIRWTVAMGDPVTGGSVYWLSDNVDAGPLAATRHLFVHPGETRQSLWQRLFHLGVDLMGGVFDDLDAGIVRQVPQDEAAATWEPSWSREPLRRPDLLALGPMPDGFRVVRK